MSQHSSQTATKAVQSNSSLTALVPIWDSGEQTLLLSHDRTFRAGRGNDCDLLIAHPGVAEWHATVIQDGGQVTVRPEHGQHVWINDQLIDRAAAVQVGDTLAIGPATFRIEARRAGRRFVPSRADSTKFNLPDISTRLEQQLSELQQQYSSAIRDSDSSASMAGHGFEGLMPSFSGQPSGNHDLPPSLAGPVYPGSVSAANATPFMDFAATTNRRSALDERETQLNEWHRSLDRRREELDKRSANLTRQQAALTARQTELDHRTAELESWHQVALEDIEDRKASVNTVAEADLRLRKEELQNQERELLKEQQQVSEQLLRMEDSRQSIADQLQTLEDARRALKEERADLAEERSRLESETRARQQADSEQEEAFREQRQKLDDFAKQLEDERTALQQQESSLRNQQERLETRNTEVAEAEERIQLAAAMPEASGRPSEIQHADATDEAAHHMGDEATEAALLLLEEQKTNLAEQQTAVQQQLDAIQRKEDEVDLLRADVEAQRTVLSDEQVALEFERAEATTALEEAHRLQQEVHDAQADRDAKADSDADAYSDDQAADETSQGSVTPDAIPSAENEALATREQELSERTQELANRLAELKLWKKQLEAREQANTQEPVAAVAKPKEVERPQSVIASQLSSLLMPPGMISEADGLNDSAANEELVVAQQHNASLQSETTELRDRVAELELQLRAAEQESSGLSSLLTQNQLPANGRALTEQNLLAELQSLKSELSDAQQTESNATENGEQVVVQSQILELEARNQTIIDNHQQEVSEYETTIDKLNEQLEIVQKQFEGLEERAMQAVAAAANPKAVGESTETAGDSPASEENSVTPEGSVAEAAPVKEADSVEQDNETVLKLKQMVELLSEKLEQRNNTIDNLQAQLNGGVPIDASASMTPQEVHVLSQELDSRTVLLDEREAALRERERLLEQSEQELQTQRVALQEARQQLELARAEIHSAREPAASESMLLPRDLIDSVTELAEAGATTEPPESFEDKSDEKSDEEDATQRSSVRSEIAELFGLGAKAKIEKPKEQEKRAPATAAELMEAVDDYSQESAAAVSLSFESAQDMLMAPDSEPTNDNKFKENPAEAPKDEADDVVASYMEQLLSRSRATADGDAPEELKKQVPNATVAGQAAPEKKPAGQASFIDKYMSGQYDSEKAGAATPEVQAEVTDQSTAEEQSAKAESAELRRSKIDRNAQRLDLQSFRELSTQSAANALATHARHKEKGGITTRTTILTTLGLISVFVVAAAVIGVIPFGWLTTLSIVAVIASGGELAYKMKTIQDEVNERTRMALMSSSVKTPGPVAGSGAVPTIISPDDSQPTLAVDATVNNLEATAGEAAAPSQNAVSSPSETVVQPTETPVAAAAANEAEAVPADDSTEVPETPADATSDANQPLEAKISDAATGESESTEDLLNSLAVKIPSAATESSQAAATSAPKDDTSSKDATDGGVPDAFDEAFRMLTSTSLPIKKPASEVQPAADDTAAGNSAAGNSAAE